MEKEGFGKTLSKVFIWHEVQFWFKLRFFWVLVLFLVIGMEWKNHAMTSIFLQKGYFPVCAVPSLFQWTPLLSFQETPGWMPSAWFHASQNIINNIRQADHPRNQSMVAPVTTPELDKPQGILTSSALHCTSRHHATTGSSFLVLKKLYILTQLFNQGAFFCAYVYIQCALLPSLYMLMSSFCFKTCLLF